MPTHSIEQFTREFYRNRVDMTLDQCKNPNVLFLAKSLSQQASCAISNLHEDLQNRSLGCGDPFPPHLEGCRVLDLGCGSGRDVFVLSQLVGQRGKVVGVDMVDEMVDKARSYVDFHTARFGYCNVKFCRANAESLLDCKKLKPNSFDLVISNAVITLCSNKVAVFSNVRKLLKPGGEFYWCDIYAEMEPNESLRQHKVLWNLGFGGALSWNKFEGIAKSWGSAEPMVIASREYKPWLDDHKGLIGDNVFHSRTIRLIKAKKKEVRRKTTETTGAKNETLEENGEAKQENGEAKEENGEENEEERWWENTDSVTLKYNGADKFTLSKDLVFRVGESKVLPLSVASAVLVSRYASLFSTWYP